jgi:hypothetical protein
MTICPCPFRYAHMRWARPCPLAGRRWPIRPLDMCHLRHVHASDDGGYAHDVSDCRWKLVGPLHRHPGLSHHQTMILQRMIRQMLGVCGRYSRLFDRYRQKMFCVVGGVQQMKMAWDVLLLFFRPAPSLSTVSSVHITRLPPPSPPRRFSEPITPGSDSPAPEPASLEGPPSSRG